MGEFFNNPQARSRTPAAINPTDGSQTSNGANSAAPASATLSNTTAGYTTLGGKFQFAAVAGAETDYALFGFQVPAGFRLFIAGVNIGPIRNTVAAVATTASVFEWALGLKSTAVSLATASLRRIQLGMQQFAIAAAIDALTANDVRRAFDPPLVAEPGEFVHLILKCSQGTATATEVFRGQADIHGFFEPAGL